MYDVIVVGARCGGAPTAMLLARAGRRVLLLERARFPADRLSTLYIQQAGCRLLSRWGLLEQVEASGAPPIERIVIELGDARLAGGVGTAEMLEPAFAPRRTVLDRILAEAAAEAGARLREGCSVISLLEEDGRVCGVTFSDAETGAVRTERAALVVGADGMRSTVAELAGAAETARDPLLTCAYYTYWEDLEADFELYEGPTGWVSTVPTNDAVLVSAYYPQDRFPRVRPRAREAYLENIAENAPALSARLAGARQADRMYGTGDQQNFFRAAVGEGWALVGDAGHHKDSLTARGITDAFMQAQMLTDRVAGVLDDRERLGPALKEYAEERDRAFTDHYQATLLIARGDRKERRQALLRVVGADPALTRLYFNTLAGISPVTDLYTPELMAKVAEQAAAATAGGSAG